VYPAPVLTGQVPLGVPTPLTRYELIWVPAAQHVLPDGSVEVVTAPDLPAGAWALSVVSFTGQTWTVPNELATEAALGADAATRAGQAVALGLR
jgi:hypothetical protein